LGRIKKLELCWKYIPLVSVRELELDSNTGVNKEDEGAGDGNLMWKAPPHFDDAPGRVRPWDVVMNYRPGHDHRKQAAMS
jgi:hypothetical protein